MIFEKGEIYKLANNKIGKIVNIYSNSLDVEVDGIVRIYSCFEPANSDSKMLSDYYCILGEDYLLNERLNQYEYPEYFL